MSDTDYPQPKSAESGVGEADTDSFCETNPFTPKTAPNPSNDINLDEPTNDAADLLNKHKAGPTLFPKDQPGLTITISPPDNKKELPM